MSWTRKPNILLVSDSPSLDTGFGRVAREIGTTLVASGQYNVACIGCYAKANDHVIPFQVFPVYIGSGKPGEHGEHIYDEVVTKFKPDLVITIGEVWSVAYIANRARKHKLIAYLPIDGHPVNPRWHGTLAKFDQVILFGPFGIKGVQAMDSTLPLDAIPHGVDLEIFTPASDEERVTCKKMLTHGKFDFVVGCVARNTTRKRLDRLVKAFGSFVLPWTTCRACGLVTHRIEGTEIAACGNCHSDQLDHGKGKPDAYLYLHCIARDRMGFDLTVIANQHGLSGRVGMPVSMEEGIGCSDGVLANVYKGMDVFCLPTGGEGFGLPILEAMAAGLPCLVTNYSGHVDFAGGAAELIDVSEFVTMRHSNGMHALSDIIDTVRKLDRFYMEMDEFRRKWGPAYAGDIGAENVEGFFAAISVGKRLRTELGQSARQRAEMFGWSDVNQMWVQKINGILKYDPALAQTERAIHLEVI